MAKQIPKKGLPKTSNPSSPPMPSGVPGGMGPMIPRVGRLGSNGPVPKGAGPSKPPKQHSSPVRRAETGPGKAPKKGPGGHARMDSGKLPSTAPRKTKQSGRF